MIRISTEWALSDGCCGEREREKRGWKI